MHGSGQDDEQLTQTTDRAGRKTRRRRAPTQSIIAREGLVHPSASVVHPKRSRNSHWIELRLKTAADLEHAARLVELAIANMVASAGQD
jgi:hypothetical protein